MVRRSKPLEKNTKLPKLPLISHSPSMIKNKIVTVAKSAQTDSLDITTLIETKVKKLKNNSFLYMMHAVPHTSEHFSSYNLM